MEGGVWAVIAGVITLALAILAEFFSGEARKRKEQQEFDKKKAEEDRLAQEEYAKTQAGTVAAGGAAQTVQDRLDRHLNDTPSGT